ncbi:tRNA threonylcarbamoyladenosine biosynthesis protein TsaB [Ruminococcus sp. YE71]|uniref:tRNA (adenosine(37)-N6)-threonylcarbamoyltransferase complex dimerization subunit type 1 TsaB n=1 Tax=unclassified Ruminococcus TaxID=2608920 RepID=UPI0008880767|nr:MULTISPECIES: tRNA (adenosine(37)-N6)-threonylcarbamoyltransferase complex dimerization subunit type 1 TsaB [unclassified Ruminococcus]SDA12436.1 tRNA threonylcarbamoyladenosine biosynthesis protein TsaB [Ruminococcus sp. YE78]SFW16889.1 tRNA threonylcarbamoyladenosine biosynthesis protein TsaB [Ruminococcus sp. YE71]
MKLLAIDTSGKVASAAVTDGGVVLAEKSVYTKLTHSQIILPMVQELLDDCGLTLGELDGIACAKGPGSYTGLRIGIAAVKGIAMGCGQLKCAGISTLEALAQNCAAYRGRIVSVMAARKGVIYLGVYESDGERVKCVLPDKVCSEDELNGLDLDEAVITGDCCEDIKARFFADKAAVKCAPFADRLQKASSLCAIFEADPDRATEADDLAAAYLQDTKAEKDKAHRT